MVTKIVKVRAVDAGKKFELGIDPPIDRTGDNVSREDKIDALFIDDPTYAPAVGNTIVIGKWDCVIESGNMRKYYYRCTSSLEEAWHRPDGGPNHWTDWERFARHGRSRA